MLLVEYNCTAYLISGYVSICLSASCSSPAAALSIDSSPAAALSIDSEKVEFYDSLRQHPC
ncbi:hypothetical protein NC651_039001 [Populus alba x Populus x berolinensis]|nr:hypothetical protein NC651_039001 [Populus alba x Populus x berolinensis]